MTEVRLTPLGGVGRFGRNCLLVEAGDAAIVIDCGARFLTTDEAPGYDVGLPDLARISALGDKLLAYVVTHGHEDHIGGLPYAARVNKKPIITTAYTARLVARRFDRVGVKLPPIEARAPGFDDPRALGPFTVRFLAVSHSIPDATCLVVDTPAGRIVHSGDFRVDLDPVLGPPTDLAGLTRAGDTSAGPGVRVLLADSTGAQIEGHNAGERSVHAPLRAAIAGAPGRVVVALFASHVQRVALLGQVARETGRKLAFLGRGLTEHHRIASDLALFRAVGNLDDVVVKDEHLVERPRHEQLWAVTGAQGEGGSGLDRLARMAAQAAAGASDANPGARPAIAPFLLEAGDRLVMSARVIPGNEVKVARALDAIAERGVDVVEGRAAPHVSGHGSQDDLRALFEAVRPREFVALHGDARHLLAHKDLVANAGLDPARVHALRDGMSLVLTADAGDASSLVARPASPSAEPVAAFGEVDARAARTIAARRRMTSAGVLLVLPDGSLETHAVFPPLTSEMREALATLAVALRAAVGRADAAPEAGSEATLAMARVFWREHRAAPEIILAGAGSH